MKYFFSLLSLLFIGNIYVTNAQTDPSKEPKTTLIVNLNGKEHRVVEGEKINKDGNTITVNIAKNRTFKTQSISFDYPTSFAFEYETVPGYKNWTFDGNNFVIMYFELSEDNTLNSFVDEITGRFGKANCKIERKSLKLGSKTLKGKRINVNLMGEKLTLDLLEINLNDGKRHIIAFQDSLNEYGTPTDEGEETLKTINKTISYK